MYVVVAFVNTALDESSTSSLDEVILRERNIVSEFRRLRGDIRLDPRSTAVDNTLSIELRRLGLDIEIIELRERDAVMFTFTAYLDLVSCTD